MSIDRHVDTIEAIARAALAKANAIEVCQFHKHVTIRVGDDDAERHAYALATNVLKSDGTIEFMREDVLEAIKDELDQAADGECPVCGSVD